MRMLDRRSRCFAVIFENQNVAKALVVFQVQHAVAITPEYIFHSTYGKRRKRCGVIWRLYDHFMRADSVHLVEQAFALAVEVALDSQRGKSIGHHPQLPSRRVRATAI